MQPLTGGTLRGLMLSFQALLALGLCQPAGQELSTWLLISAGLGPGHSGQ